MRYADRLKDKIEKSTYLHVGDSVGRYYKILHIVKQNKKLVEYEQDNVYSISESTSHPYYSKKLLPKLKKRKVLLYRVEKSKINEFEEPHKAKTFNPFRMAFRPFPRYFLICDNECIINLKNGEVIKDIISIPLTKNGLEWLDKRGEK